MTKKKNKLTTSRKASSASPSLSSSKSSGNDSQATSRSPVDSSPIVCDLVAAAEAGSDTPPSLDLNLENPATAQIGDVEIDLLSKETIENMSSTAKSTVAVTSETSISNSNVAVILETPTANPSAVVDSETQIVNTTVAVSSETPTTNLAQVVAEAQEPPVPSPSGKVTDDTLANAQIRVKKRFVPVQDSLKPKNSDLHGKPAHDSSKQSVQSQLPPPDRKGKSIDLQPHTSETKGPSDPGTNTFSKIPPHEFAGSSKAIGGSSFSEAEPDSSDVSSSDSDMEEGQYIPARTKRRSRGGRGRGPKHN
ncbi:hypothetical protein YC2023_031622 [Brassica napus]